MTIELAGPPDVPRLKRCTPPTLPGTSPVWHVSLWRCPSSAQPLSWPVLSSAVESCTDFFGGCWSRSSLHCGAGTCSSSSSGGGTGSSTAAGGVLLGLCLPSAPVLQPRRQPLAMRPLHGLCWVPVWAPSSWGCRLPAPMPRSASWATEARDIPAPSPQPLADPAASAASGGHNSCAG